MNESSEDAENGLVVYNKLFLKSTSLIMALKQIIQSINHYLCHTGCNRIGHDKHCENN